MHTMGITGITRATDPPQVGRGGAAPLTPRGVPPLTPHNV
jgi:hypothetical protein